MSLIANIFVRAHHLSTETQRAVLGLERTQREGNSRQGQLGSPTQDRSVELSRIRGEGLRLRS